MNIIGQLKNKKDFIGFLTLNCFDKAFIFLLPIILMFLTQSQELYNDLEYVFSLANVFVPFLVFISSYSFYGYKISHNKEVFVKHYNVICCASILLLTLLSAILLCTMKCTALYVWIYLFVAVRLCYQFYLSCYNNYYRLTDAPTVVLWISIASSVLSVVLMLVVGKIGLKEYSLYAFFLPQSFPIFYSIRSIRACFKTEFWKEWGEYIRNAILFAWPAVLNCTIVAFVMNYGKIYAYNELTSDEMYNFSYIMRISLVVQMMHSSVMAYYSKHIYLNGFKKSFLVKYVGLLFFALAIAFTFLMAFNVFAEKPIPVNLIVVLLFAYTLFYCTGSLLEMHFGRINKNHLILIASAISAIVYLSIVFTVKIKSLLPLAVAMLVNSILFLMLMCLFAMLNKKEFWNKGGV